MTTTLETINAEIVSDVKNEKICLIEDIFKLKNALMAFGIVRHRDVIDEPVAVFDSLYELDIQALEDKQIAYSKSLKHIACERAGFASDEQPIK